MNQCRILGTAAFLCSIMFSVCIALAQSPNHHPPQDMELHERFYKDWMMPDAPFVSCCDSGDCYPTEARFDQERHSWFARRREDGKWLQVPAAKVERKRANPDGRSHMCAPKPENVHYGVEIYCFTFGIGM